MSILESIGRRSSFEESQQEVAEATEWTKRTLADLCLECGVEDPARFNRVGRASIGTIGSNTAACLAMIEALAKRVHELEMALAARDIVGR